jgi:hypothetical protein
MILVLIDSHLAHISRCSYNFSAYKLENSALHFGVSCESECVLKKYCTEPFAYYGFTF